MHTGMQCSSSSSAQSPACCLPRPSPCTQCAVVRLQSKQMAMYCAIRQAPAWKCVTWLVAWRPAWHDGTSRMVAPQFNPTARQQASAPHLSFGSPPEQARQPPTAPRPTRARWAAAEHSVRTAHHSTEAVQCIGSAAAQAAQWAQSAGLACTQAATKTRKARPVQAGSRCKNRQLPPNAVFCHPRLSRRHSYQHQPIICVCGA